MKEINTLEKILDRLLEWKNSVTDESFMAALDAKYVVYHDRLKKAREKRARDIIDYKLRDLTRELE